MSRLATIEEVSNEFLDDSLSSSSISKRFTYSIHNCHCSRRKFGLILFPKDSQLENIILLICPQCYNYRNDQVSAHLQLENWYFQIYQDAEIFRFKSKFIQNEDQSIEFEACRWEKTIIEERELQRKEKQIVQRIISIKMKSELDQR